MTLLRTRTEGRFWSRCRLLLWLLLLELFDGKTYFAFFINRQNLYFYLVLFAEEIMNVLYINVCNFRDMDQTSLTF